MSKLSKLAWKRNGTIGRISSVKGRLVTILQENINRKGPKLLTGEEVHKLMECRDIIDDILDHKDKNWEHIKSNLNP